VALTVSGRSALRFAMTTAFDAGRRVDPLPSGPSTWGTSSGSRFCPWAFGNVGNAKCAVRLPTFTLKVRRFLKWVGLVFSIALSLLMWALPVDSNFGVLSWSLRVAAPAEGSLLLFDLLRGPKEPSLRRNLATIAPATDTACPFCATPLLAGSGTRWSCPQCGAVRY
jgi:hypothetical protein